MALPLVMVVVLVLAVVASEVFHQATHLEDYLVAFDLVDLASLAVGQELGLAVL